MKRSVLESGVPARLTTDQVGQKLNFHPTAIDHLVRVGLLKELGGHPERGCQRMFAAVYIEELWSDIDWLAKATKSVRKYFRDRNADYKAKRTKENESGESD